MCLSSLDGFPRVTVNFGNYHTALSRFHVLKWIWTFDFKFSGLFYVQPDFTYFSFLKWLIFTLKTREHKDCISQVRLGYAVITKITKILVIFHKNFYLVFIEILLKIKVFLPDNDTSCTDSILDCLGMTVSFYRLMLLTWLENSLEI